MCVCVSLKFSCLEAFYIIAPNLSATGVISAMRANDWGLPALCRNKDEWKGCLIIGDGAQVNKLVYRYLITETSAFKRLLVAVSPCWAHNISSATKWSVGNRCGCYYLFIFK